MKISKRNFLSALSSLAVIAFTFSSCKKDPEKSKLENEKLAAANCPRVAAAKEEKEEPLYNVTTYAGSYGSRGTVDGPLCKARFNYTESIVTGADGTLYVADQTALRKITPEGIVSTLSKETGLAELEVDIHGNLYGYSSRSLYKIDSKGRSTRIAGTGEEGYKNGPAKQAKLPLNASFAVKGDGSIYFVDWSMHEIREISASGYVSRYAGKDTVWTTSEGGFRDGPREQALFDKPALIAEGTDGALYVTGSRRYSDRPTSYVIRKITPDGMVSTYLNTYDIGILDIVFAADGSMYLATWKQILKISKDKQVTIVAGEMYEESWEPDDRTNFKDGVGLKARFAGITGITIRGKYMYIAEWSSGCIRRMRIE
jgi:hypothetical protein